MSTLYVLELCDGKFFVAKVSDKSNCNPVEIINPWTIMYPAVRICFSKPYVREEDWDDLVYQVMMHHSIENVRGGRYSKVHLNSDQYSECYTELLRRYITRLEDVFAIPKQETRQRKNFCYRCGRDSHHKRCTYMKDRDGGHISGRKCYCERCGKANHDSNDCYSTFTYNGYEI